MVQVRILAKRNGNYVISGGHRQRNPRVVVVNKQHAQEIAAARQRLMVKRLARQAKQT